MADRTLDLQSALSGLRRHRTILIAAALLGALLGIGAVALWPPMYVSSSLVLLPPKGADPDQLAEQVKTDTRIAMSDAVLGRATRMLRPRMSTEELGRHVEVSPVTPLILEIRGRAEEPQQAEAISRAVATADVDYAMGAASSLSAARRALMAARQKELESMLTQIDKQIEATTARQLDVDPSSSQGKADATALAKLTAQKGSLVLDINELSSETDAAQPSGGASIIQQESPAKRAGLVGRTVAIMLAGALLALALAAGAVTLLTRRDRRLIFRDDIADAVGSPVVASIRTRARESVADWVALLREPDLTAVEAWTWRQALRQLFPSAPGSGRDRSDQRSSIIVVTLSSDSRGLATGPQLAAYAATAGLRTHLVPAQRHETAAPLWAACANVQQDGDAPSGLTVGARPLEDFAADLTVVLMVLDRQHPEMVEVAAEAVVVLALSAGSATAEELARVAMAVDETGRRIHGLVVTDPDDFDRTSGRLLQPDRVHQIPLPTRLTGTPTPRLPREPRSTPRRSQG